MPLAAGAAQINITPTEPMFLYGYPHVPRISTGVHDPLYASALYLDDGAKAILLISVDVLMLNHETAQRCRQVIQTTTGVTESHILISTTHTHSAPVTAQVLAFRDDPVVPPVDRAYLDQVSTAIVRAAREAVDTAQPAEVAVTTALAQDVGGNRHGPGGPTDPEVGIVAVRGAKTRRMLALDITYSMHPTVLHEDSTLVSADFPGYTRAYLTGRMDGLTTVYHTGPSGNQSPRYFVSKQTFAEAKRLGNTLGEAIWSALSALEDGAFSDGITVAAAQVYASLPGRTFPPAEEAEAMLAQARITYAQLQREGAPHGPTRTAEVAVFGAEERVTLAKAQASGAIDDLLSRYARVPVQVLRVGDTFLVGLPGELFVEYGLQIKAALDRQAFVISLANGELQGYVVTPDATGYEAGISLFLPAAGPILVSTALDLASTLLGPFTRMAAANH